LRNNGTAISGENDLAGSEWSRCPGVYGLGSLPVEFLSDEQVGVYGRFTGELSAAEVERFFYLDDADRNQALAGVRAGDALVVPKLDRLARSVPDARAIGDDLADRGIKLSLGGQVYDPADPMGKMFFNILATFAEFEVDLLRMRTREGMAVARAKGKLRGKQPKLSARQQRELARMAWHRRVRPGRSIQRMNNASAAQDGSHELVA
jgi:hypothetical protein